MIINNYVQVELGRTKEEAKNSLARLLQNKKAVDGQNADQPPQQNYGYKDWVKRRQMDKYREMCVRCSLLTSFWVSLDPVILILIS